MNKKKKLRLLALLAKAAADLTPEEKTELSQLQELAKTSKFDAATAKKEDIEKEADEAEGMTESEVKGIVVEALKTIGLDKDAVAKIQKSLETPGKSLTAEELSKVIKENLGGTSNIDVDVLSKALAKNLETNKGVSEAQLTKALDEFSKNFRRESKAQFETGAADFPIEHRSGNLSVAQKQLANICLQHVDTASLAKSGLRRPADMNEGITEDQLKTAKRNGDLSLKRAMAEVVYGGKALTAGGAGTGAELVNQDLSSDLQMRLYLESPIAAEFISQEINMPSDPFQLPMITTRPTFYVGSEGGTPTGSTPGTARITLAAKKLIGFVDYSYESDEDAIIAILPMLQDGLAAAAADALEGAIINGDTTATHQDSDIHAVANHYAKLFKGLRKYALAGSLGTSLATGGISAANIGVLRKNLGKYGVRPRDVLIICGVSGYNDLVQLEETLTADKVGNNVARILTGDAPSLYGMRVVTSSQVRENLNASGVYDGITVTKGSIFLVHKPSWIMGVKRGFTIEVDVDKKTQMNSVIASFRRDFQPKETPSAAQSLVTVGYNYTA